MIARPATLLFFFLTAGLIAVATAVSFGFVSMNSSLSANSLAVSTLQNQMSQQGSLISSLRSQASSNHGTVTTTVTVSPSSSSTSSSISSITCESTQYTVQNGDTLKSIAAKRRITWQILAYANGLSISNSTTVQTGELLSVPVAGTCLIYKVLTGDYVYKIATELGFPDPAAETQLIIKANYIRCNSYCLITPNELLFIVIPLGK
jgi:LysM repeat protein